MIRSRSMILAAVGAALFWGTTLPSAGEEDSPLSDGSVRELILSSPPGTRTSYFALEGETSRAWMRWMRGPDPEALREAGWRVELETYFPAIETRVLHTERLGSSERKLVWREVRAQSGRTLLAEWDERAGLRSSETFGTETIRREFGGFESSGFTPLHLVEWLRVSSDCKRAVQRYDPLANALEEFQIEGASFPALPGPLLSPSGQLAMRAVQLRRKDGSPGPFYVFRGEELVLFRLQEGGPWARRISARAYRDLFETNTDPGH